MTDAAVHDSQAMTELVEETDGMVHADRAYTGETITGLLEEHGGTGEIGEKGYRGHPLTERQKKSNRKKSKIGVRGGASCRVHDEYDEGRVEDARDRDEEDRRRGWGRNLVSNMARYEPSMRLQLV
ncbi:MAG: transposase [Nitrospira sp.]|nr:transposase [Nitrospira sp.]